MKTFLEERSHLAFEEIQKYLSNDLNAEALHKIENHLLDCSLCSGAIEGFRSSVDSGEDRKALKKLDKKLKLKAGRGKITVMWSMKIAASLLFLLGSVFTVFHLQSNSSIDNYTSMIKDEFSLGSRFGVNETEFKKAISFCESSEYSSCINALNKCVEKQPDNVGLKYFVGLAYFQNGDYEKAIENLNKIRISDSSYYDDAFWFKILAHVKNDEKSKAMKLLEEYTIQTPNGFYFEEVQKLKSELD